MRRPPAMAADPPGRHAAALADAAGGGVRQLGQYRPGLGLDRACASAASAASVSASIRCSVRASAPVSRMIDRSRATPPSSRPGRRARRPAPPGRPAARPRTPPPPGRSACPRAGRRRPACRSRAGSPNTPSTSSRSWNASPSGSPYAGVGRRTRVRRAPASAAPSSSGRSTVYFADLYRATLPARSTEVSPVACVSTSRYCPTVTSVRISSKTGRARARRPASRPRGVQQLVGPDQAQVAEQDRRAVAERRPGRPRQPARARAGPRTGGARPARRGGCPSGPSGRRGSARWPARSSSAATAATTGVAVGAAGARGNPSRRTPAAAACRRRSTNASTASATSGQRGVDGQQPARWRREERGQRLVDAGTQAGALERCGHHSADASRVARARSRPGRYSRCVSTRTSFRPAARRARPIGELIRRPERHVLVRVLPAEDAGGRAAALAGDPRAGAAAPVVRVDHLRRRRLHPGHHRRGHRADRRPRPRCCRWPT